MLGPVRLGCAESDVTGVELNELLAPERNRLSAELQIDRIII